MSRPEGLPKTGGRQKGTPNRRTAKFAEILDQNDFDPVSEIISLLPQLSARERVGALLSLLPYSHPKVKATEPQFNFEDALQCMMGGIASEE